MKDTDKRQERGFTKMLQLQTVLTKKKKILQTKHYKSLLGDCSTLYHLKESINEN